MTVDIRVLVRGDGQEAGASAVGGTAVESQRIVCTSDDLRTLGEIIDTAPLLAGKVGTSRARLGIFKWRGVEGSFAVRDWASELDVGVCQTVEGSKRQGERTDGVERHVVLDTRCDAVVRAVPQLLYLWPADLIV